jgi:hypothetical protein
MMFEKTEVLFCYGKYPILILMNEPLSLSILCYNQVENDENESL